MQCLIVDYAVGLVLPEKNPLGKGSEGIHAALSRLESEILCPSLIGERALVLRVLSVIRHKSGNVTERRLLARALWRYLQIKGQFLGTVQQREGYSGFDFFEYTLRLLEMPNNFIEPTRTAARVEATGEGYDPELETGAWFREIGRFLQECHSVVKLELMIAPQTDRAAYERLQKRINDHLRPIMEERLAQDLRHTSDTKVEIGFIVHFIKNEDLPLRKRRVPDNDCPHAYRIYHGSLRKKILDQANVIDALLRDNPDYPIRAIDTANRELHCPPEVFASTYRHFKRRPIRKTFHVGEDFLHLTTGIRRIFEALEYLELRAGDRLGHCVALGVDARQWVHSNPFVTMHRIDLLDDAVFEWTLLQEHGTAELHRLSNLERQIAKQSMAIFGEPVDPHILQESWRRRGNDPRTDGAQGFDQYVPEWIIAQGELLYAPSNAPDSDIGAHSYLPNISGLRQLSDRVLSPRDLPRDHAERILMEYLYDRRTIEREIELEVVETAGELPYIVRLQEIVRSLIKSRGITVESNPSSNWLIGGLERLYDAPAVQWTLRHPDFPISINPDDPTVFATSIENEYFYVFSCLLKGTDDIPGLSRIEALQRIRRLREHGLASSFLQGTSRRPAL